MSNWWANKLASETSRPAVETPRPTYTPAPVQPRGYSYPQTQEVAEPPPTPKASSARHTETCPDCGSGNYVGTGETRKRCYDCGYPIVQSGTGMSASGASTVGPPQQARQAPSAGYHPEIIIGRIQ